MPKAHDCLIMVNYIFYEIEGAKGAYLLSGMISLICNYCSRPREKLRNVVYKLVSYQ